MEKNENELRNACSIFQMQLDVAKEYSTIFEDLIYLCLKCLEASNNENK